MKIIRVDMTSGTISQENAESAFTGMGGRGLTSFFVDKEVPPMCDPLGPENKLIFAPGYLSGSSLVNSSRLSVGAKSPLTGGIKESNVGGTVAADLGRIGISAIIIEGKSKEDQKFILTIDKEGGAALVDGSAYAGNRTYALVKSLKETYGDDKSITCIGPAGEFQLSAASIQTTDRDGRPCRAAGRGGLGAVMGSKGLKAIIVDKNAKSPEPIQDPKVFKESAKIFAKAVLADEFTAELAELGSAVLVEPINAAGAFPTRNAREGQFEDADKISGETMTRIIKSRGGKQNHKGCAQCIINCSNEYVDENGVYVTSSLEYETIWSMGGMIGQVLGIKAGDRLHSLTLCNTMCEVPEAARAMFEDRVTLANAEGMEAHVEPTIERWFSPEFCTARPDQVDPIRELIRTTPIPGFAGCCLAIAHLNLTDKLGSISTPTLVITGREDPGATPEVAETIQRNIPGAELCIIDGALHLSNIEQPEIFNAAFSAHISKH